MLAHPWFPGVKKCFPNTFSCRAAVLHPDSRGHLALPRTIHTKPSGSTRISFPPRDMEVLLEELDIVRSVMTQPALDPHRGKEITPGADVTSRGGVGSHTGELRYSSSSWAPAAWVWMRWP